jgi:acetyltransferase-like isoleucine patch superfamily enzyme
MNSSIRNNISRKLIALYEDPKGRILFKLDKLTQKELMYLVNTPWCRMLAYAWGIKLGSSCMFYGITQFSRFPGSIIKIGDLCHFRSTFRSNMIGINHPCGISTHSKGAEISIGKNCGLSGTIIGAAKRIVLGNNVFCGANVTITDFDWHGLNITQREKGGVERAEPVFINDGVWLGLNTLVLKGVTIGKNTVVGANSVVTKSLPENVIAAGNPAKVLRVLDISL